MAKRGYGTGRLHQKHGNWYGRWRTADGTQVNRKLGVAGRDGLNKTQAEKALRAAMSEEVVNVRSSARSSVTELGQQLVVRLESRGRKPSHIKNVRSHMRVHIDPYFDRQGLAVERLDEVAVERFVASLRRKDLKPKTVHNIVATLHATVALAVPRRIAANPVDLSIVPAKSNASRTLRYLTLAELEGLLRAEPRPMTAWWPTDRVMWLVAAMTGLRLGELLGLRWRDVDWHAMRVRVRQNIVHGVDGTPKSGRGRSVPMTDRVAGELERHFQRTDFTADDDLVFGKPDWSPQLPAAPLKRFKRALKRAGLSDHRIHDLRHTFGTTCAASGRISMRTLQEWMGHADYQTTLIYADYAPAVHERDQLESAFAWRPGTVAASA